MSDTDIDVIINDLDDDFDSDFEANLVGRCDLGKTILNLDPVGSLIGESFRFAAGMAPFVPGQSEKIVAVFQAVLDAMETSHAAANPDNDEAYAVLKRLMERCRDDVLDAKNTARS